ncbi:hypothetical protein BDP27DRAFT_1431145 [Rhodocollybia butyracea]|uniref:Uncharacterized protein n=1 Tax=Rhodocollybia butyracea TaxID=206335 RepID=A0A9P5TYU9_9AGAR|nr:hypothetical protein BDP27DRAFT_1431145 [Rhodocollybia butyracea]
MVDGTCEKRSVITRLVNCFKQANGLVAETRFEKHLVMYESQKDRLGSADVEVPLEDTAKMSGSLLSSLGSPPPLYCMGSIRPLTITLPYFSASSFPRQLAISLVDVSSHSNVLFSTNSSSQNRVNPQTHNPSPPEAPPSGLSNIYPSNILPRERPLKHLPGNHGSLRPRDKLSYADVTEGDKQVDAEKDRRKVLIEMRAAIGRGQPESADAVFFRMGGVAERLFLSEKAGKVNANVGPLLERGVVSGLMVEDVDFWNTTTLLQAVGVMGMPSISLALKTVKDLQEVDVVACLRFVLARHRQSQAQDKSQRAQGTASDAMQVHSLPSMGVGTDADVPTLPAFLSLLLHSRFSASTTSSNTTMSLNLLNSTSNTSISSTSAMPTFSTPALRFAFRRYLSYVDDVICILEAIKKAKKGQGVEKENNLYADIPGMSQILTFLQPLLDTTFITLIQAPPAYCLLRTFKA